MARHRPEAQVTGSFGRAVQACRHELGVTQEELAHRAKVHRTYLADIERGFRNPTLKIICRLAEALDLTAEDLLGRARL